MDGVQSTPVAAQADRVGQAADGAVETGQGAFVNRLTCCVTSSHATVKQRSATKRSSAICTGTALVPAGTFAGKGPAVDATGAPAAQKSRKRTRVNTALTALRREGLETFRDHVEKRLNEQAQLMNALRRVRQTEGLGTRKDCAIALLEARLLSLGGDFGNTTPPDTEPLAAQRVPVAEIQHAAEAPLRLTLTLEEAQFIDTCRLGTRKSLARQMQQGRIDVNMGTEWGTPLVLAANWGRTGIVRELLSAPGIDPNLAAPRRSTPLFFAAQNGHAEVVKLLLQRGANANRVAGRNATPLLIATEQGQTDVVKLLLAVRGINVNAASSTLQTPLGAAAEFGWEEIVALLLDAPGIDINPRNEWGATPLIAAAQNNYPGIVDRLIRRGADVNRSFGKGTTPLAKAAEGGFRRIVKSLLRSPEINFDRATDDGVTALSIASQNGHAAVVGMLLKKGANVNATHAPMLNPLQAACFHGRTAVIRLLLRHGADPDTAWASNTRSYTPHELAELGGHRGAMSILENWPPPAKPEAATSDRWSSDEEAEWWTPPTSPPSTRKLAALPAPGTGKANLRSTPAVGRTGQCPAAASLARTPEAIKNLHSRPLAANGTSTPKTPPPVSTLAKDALRREVLHKTINAIINQLDGIRLLEEICTATHTDQLCTLYNRLALVERQMERARRRGHRRERHRLTPNAVLEPASPQTPEFTLGGQARLNADQVEGAIRQHIDQRYHRFVSQVVNDMEFGRGKATGRTGLLHASAGIPGVGSCSVFFSRDNCTGQIQILGIGHHVDSKTYRLEYACGELGKPGSRLCIS